MTDRIRTADETAAQRPEIPTAAEVAQISAGWREATRLRQERDAAYQENARLRGRLITETAERVAAQAELADVRIQRDRLAADHTALTGRHLAQGQELDDVRSQLGAAQNALAAVRHGVEVIDRALAGYDTQQPTAPDPAEQLVAAHRAGYDQAIDNLRDRDRFIAWQMSDRARTNGGAREHFAAYLADTYEIPA